MSSRKIRVRVGKPGLDVLDGGAKTIVLREELGEYEEPKSL